MDAKTVKQEEKREPGRGKNVIAIPILKILADTKKPLYAENIAKNIDDEVHRLRMALLRLTRHHYVQRDLAKGWARGRQPFKYHITKWGHKRLEFLTAQ